jgi:hypothetical protein
VAPLLVVALLPLAACRPDTVRLSFRPRPGAHYRYEIRVRSVTTIRLGDEPARTTTDAAVLVADHTVLSPGPGGARVRVELHRTGSQTRTFVVRLDRAAQLQEIERIEGQPAGAFGETGLTEVFTPAASAPPDRPLHPGDRWAIGRRIRLADSTSSRLSGTGRLIALGIVRGRKTAQVRSTTTLPIVDEARLGRGRQQLRGVEVTDATTIHDLTDGAVEKSRSTARGTFDVVVLPPSGQGEGVTGRLTVVVHAAIVRR